MNVLSGNAYILWVDTTTPLTAERGLYYRPIVCGVSNGFGMDIESISTRNKCDGGYDTSLPGYLTSSFDMDGQAIGLKQADKIAKANFQEMAQLALDKRVFWVKLDDVQSTVKREGRAWISSYRETANLDNPFTFTCNFNVTGKPILEANIFKTVLATDQTGTELLQDGNNNLIENKDGN